MDGQRDNSPPPRWCCHPPPPKHSYRVAAYGAVYGHVHQVNRHRFFSPFFCLVFSSSQAQGAVLLSHGAQRAAAVDTLVPGGRGPADRGRTVPRGGGRDCTGDFACFSMLFSFFLLCRSPLLLHHALCLTRLVHDDSINPGGGGSELWRSSSNEGAFNLSNLTHSYNKAAKSPVQARDAHTKQALKAKF